MNQCVEGWECVTPPAALTGVNSLALALSSTLLLMFLLGLAQESAGATMPKVEEDKKGKR